MEIDSARSRSAAFEAYVGMFAARFPRAESRRQMRSYVRGLLRTTDRKNGWTLAATAGDPGPQRMQRLLNFYAWDCDGVRDDLRTAVIAVLQDPTRGVLIADETRFLKRGVKSAGVARQRIPSSARVENAQIGVFLTYASDRGQCLVDRELYLPKEWTDDPERRRSAGIDDDVEFASKPHLARRMIERALAAGVPFGWVTAHEDYGRDEELRQWLEARGVGYVMAVPSDVTVISLDAAEVRADALVNGLDDTAWQHLGRDGGEPGTAVAGWAAVDLGRPVTGTRARLLLAVRDSATPSRITYHMCFGPFGTPVEELLRVARARLLPEKCYRMMRDEIGFDHYQVRGYQAWYRHITLSMVAGAFVEISRLVSEETAHHSGRSARPVPDGE